MLDESIENRRRVSRYPVIVSWVASVVLNIASLAVDSPESKTLHHSLQIACIVFMIGGLIFMRRHHTKERKWRETGKWE